MTIRFRAYPAVTLLALTTVGRFAAATEVALCTDRGPVTIELLEAESPAATANFLHYVETGSYSGTVFHRVIEDTIAQGGGFDRDFAPRATFGTVENESRNRVSNRRGTVAAARTDDPDSAAAQFFINLGDNTQLDGTNRQPGYTVFGRVTAGLETIDEIAALPTRAAGPFPQDVPDPLVAIVSAAVLDAAALEAVPEPRIDTLRERIAAAGEDGTAVLEAVDLLRSLCAPLEAEVLLAEARAAAAVGRPFRARYALDDYFRTAAATDPGLAEAESLRTSLAEPPARRSVAPLVADCAVPNLPSVPSGRTADLDAMLTGQDAVRAFLADSEMYLDCLARAIDEDDLSDAQHANAVRQHNQMVRLMEELAEDFNREVREFKSRE